MVDRNNVREIQKNGGEKNTMKRENGITLIALIITIIILVILAAVSVRAIYEMGIVNHAVNGTQKYAEEAVKENQMLDSTGALIEDTIGKLGQIQGNGGGSTKDITTLQTNTTKPYLPDSSFHVSTVASEQTVEGGLVITDGTNEFVWIPVPMTEDVYTRTGIGVTTISPSVCETIYSDLKAYTSAYSNSSYSDTYNSGMGTIGSIADEDDYLELRNKMLRSVYENGGFWIGRYEAGNSGGTLNISAYYDENGAEVLTADEMGDSGYYKATWSGGTAVSKKDMKPYNFVTLSQAQSLAESFASTGYESTLMFGIQWDLVLKFLENSASDTTITSNSTTWGNYYNAGPIDITSPDAYYSETFGATWSNTNISTYKKADNKAVLLTTGASTYTNRKNIYDIAGNVYEWTLEYTGTSFLPRTSRGGRYNNNGDNNAAVNRNFIITSDSRYSIGFRPSLFKSVELDADSNEPK